MSSIPDTTPGELNITMQKGMTWPGIPSITMSRNGTPVIPVSASLVITEPDGTVAVNLAATINGGGVMTIPAISAATTVAYTWQYGTVAFITIESGSVTTLLLSGNANLVDRTD